MGLRTSDDWIVVGGEWHLGLEKRSVLCMYLPVSCFARRFNQTVNACANSPSCSSSLSPRAFHPPIS